MKILTGYLKFSKCHSIVALLFIIVLIFSNKVQAQSDSLILVEKGLEDTTHFEKLDPKKAAFYSAALPGLGQIYNGKYWKLPIVYGGFGVTVYVVFAYQKIYHQYLNYLYVFDATGALPKGKTESTVRYIIDRSRRNRDYYMIVSAIWYFLQIVDAHVDAHLQEFKVNKELRVSLNPSVQQNLITGRTTGFALTFKF